MNKKTTQLFGIVFMMLTCLGVIAHAQIHPRLLFGPEQIPELRTKITIEPWKTMYETLIADAESGQYRNYTGRTPENPDITQRDPWGESSNLMRCAFLYVLTGDDAWAQKARTYAEWRIYDTTNQPWGSAGVKGLLLYFHGNAVALAYDFCYGAPSWDPAFCTIVSQKLKLQADIIADSGGTEQNTNPASNWQGIRGSAGGTCFLATDEPYSQTKFNNMFNKAEAYVRENIGSDPNSKGWNIEGIGYLGYPWAHVAPFAIAARRNDPTKDLLASTPGSAYTLWTQYAATVRFNRPGTTDTGVWILHPDFGNDNATADDANGCFGLAFELSLDALKPGMRHWYEETLVPENNWDHTRAGTIYSILYYPDDVPAADPLSIPEWRNAFLDTHGNGYFTFRNQYVDHTDMVSQLYVKLRGNKGHNGPDALSFRILGLNTAWAVGGGRYGPQINGQEAYWRSMNTLYPVNPEAALSTNGNSGQVVGTPVVFPDGSGHVVSEIVKNNVGTTNHKRWFVSDYSKASGVDAVYVIADTSLDGYFWQINTLDEPGINVTTDGNTFTITGHDGSSMRGTVLYPSSSVYFETGTRIRGSEFAYHEYGLTNKFVKLAGDGDYVVVLTVAASGQIHPTVSKTGGRVLHSTVMVGDNKYAILSDGIGYDQDAPAVGAAPNAPSGLIAIPSINFQQIDLHWQDNSSNEEGFIVYRSLDNVNWQAVTKVTTPNVTLTSNTCMESGATYFYKVCAYNMAATSSFSNVAEATVVDASMVDLIAEESFEGCALASLSEQGSGGGWGGMWNMNNSVVVDVSSNPLAVNGIDGGSKAVRVGYATYGAERRFCSSLKISNSQPIYYSYLLRFESGVRKNGLRAWVSNTYTNYDWWTAGVQTSAQGDFRLSSNYDNVAQSGPQFDVGDTVMVVVKVTSSQTVMWLSPTSETETPALTHFGWGFRLSLFTGLRLTYDFHGGNQGDVFLMDRLMVGKSFESVVYGGQAPDPQAPFMVSQPTDQVVYDGAIATFTALAQGHPLPRYQWQYFDGVEFVDLLGADESSYSIETTPANDGLLLRCLVYNDHGSLYSNTVELTVLPNALPTVSIIYPTTGSSFESPAQVIVQAQASDSDGTVMKVEFYVDGLLVGEDNSAPFTYSWQQAAVGQYSIQALAYDNHGAVGYSPAITLFVDPPPPNNGYILLTQNGIAFTENFNAMGTSSQPPVGWTWSANSTPNQTISGTVTLNGTATGTPTNGVYNAFSNSNTSNRSLGSMGGSSLRTIDVSFKNETGQPLESVDIALLYKLHFARGSSDVNNRTAYDNRRVFYSRSGLANTWMALPQLDVDFTLDPPPTSNVTFDSNAPQNQKTRSASINFEPHLQPGKVFFIRWFDPTGLNSDGQPGLHGSTNMLISMDDLSVTPHIAAVDPGPSFSGWINDQHPGVTDPEIVGVFADGDNDGLSNLVEYAFGLSATQPDGHDLLTLEQVGAGAQLYYNLRKDMIDCTVRIEVSPDLVTWHSDEVTITVDTDLGEMQRMRADFSNTQNWTSYFFRFVVEQ